MEKKRFLTLLDNLSKTARQDNWIATYNKTLDYFSWTKPSLSKDSSLVKIAHDIFLHFDKKGGVEGLDIEYLTSNFIEHHDSNKNLLQLFTEQKDGGVFTIPEGKKGQYEVNLENLLENVKLEIYEDALNTNQGVDDLEKLVDVALKSKA